MPESYKISFPIEADKEFGTKKAALAYLNEEVEIWEVFSAEFESADVSFGHNQYGKTTANGCFQNLKLLKTTINELAPVEFNRLTKINNLSRICLPPSDSLYGQLLLGLHLNKRQEDVVAALTYYIASFKGLNSISVGNVQNIHATGSRLFDAAKAAEALPFNKKWSRQITSVGKSASSFVDGLKEEIEKSHTVNSEHEEALADIRSETEDRMGRIETFLLKREKRRQTICDKRLEGFLGVQSELSQQQTALVRNQADLAEKKEKLRQTQFDQLEDLFKRQFRYKAPVKLWEDRAASHNLEATKAMDRFVRYAIATTLFAISVPLSFGGYIAESFFFVSCLVESGIETCSRVVSAKGPLTVGGLLIFFSVMLWITRLQYRVHLSERHLALDASEKKAFAQTYLALVEDKTVGKDSEAIVLGSLFRPTQDGIIKDDDSSLDLSAAAILAKQLGRTGQT